MKIVREDLWKFVGFPSMIVVTTNAIVKRNGCLVMGRGAAYQARERIRGIDVECGKAISCHDWYYPDQPYGFLEIRSPYREGKVGFGIFQVKEVYSDAADTHLIELSIDGLKYYAERNPHVAIRMNFPGIGNGRLSRDVVEPLLELLPDNVTICYK